MKIEKKYPSCTISVERAKITPGLISITITDTYNQSKSTVVPYVDLLALKDFFTNFKASDLEMSD